VSAAYYQTPEWRAIRAAVIARDPVCKTPACGRTSTHADHIIPREQGGPDTMSNLRGLCASCHNRRSARGRNVEPRVVGCDANGNPLDPAHWWNR